MNLRKLSYLSPGYYKRLNDSKNLNNKQRRFAKQRFSILSIDSFRKKIQAEVLNGLRSSKNIFVDGSIRISSVLYAHLKKEFSLNGRFKNSSQLLLILNLIKSRYLNEKEYNTVNDSSFLFRIYRKRSELWMDKHQNLRPIFSKCCILSFKFIKTEEVTQNPSL